MRKFSEPASIKYYAPLAWLRHEFSIPDDWLQITPHPHTRATSCSSIRRLAEFYRRMADLYFMSQGQEISPQTCWEDRFWGDNFKSDVHYAAYQPNNLERLAELLACPVNSELWHGFSWPTRSVNWRDGLDIRNMGSWDYDILYSFAETVGVIRQRNIENMQSAELLSPDRLIELLEAGLKTELSFPAPFPEMGGIKSNRGLIYHRSLWGLYLACLLKELKCKTVLEIGAGLGWGAWHATSLGIRRYEIVDLPLTSLAAAHFLKAANPKIKLGLAELENDASIRFHSPAAFPMKRVDAVVNMDSLTEMPRETALNYLEKIKKITPLFISINHEANAFTVAELLRNDQSVRRYSRKPFYLRKGYVEEIFEFRQNTDPKKNSLLKKLINGINLHRTN